MSALGSGNDFRMKVGILVQYLYPLVSSGFFLAFVLLYNPFDLRGYYGFGSFSPEFHIVMLSCIILLTLLVMRTVLYFILRKVKLKWWHYGVWVALEGAFMSAFAALYTVLFKSGNYFDVLPTCLKSIFLILCYPYMYLIFVRIVKIKDEELLLRSEPQDNSLVKFHDEHKRLKLSIAPSAILYINSEFNYVSIHYLESGRVKDYLLRASMKSIEAMNVHCLVRCHRSYFVNPEHVSVLRKDGQGSIIAEMDIQGVPAVPVSKQYYDALSKLL